MVRAASDRITLMANYSSHQKKIIERYYDRRDQIMIDRLQAIVSELYLATTDRKRDQLWKRAATAMGHLKVKPPVRDRILAKSDPADLARHLTDWLKNPPTG